jgi:hypothetical protein
MRFPGRLMSVLLPWPAKAQRRAAIDRARGEKERSQAAAAHAEILEGQVRRMAAENHFAGKLADHIMRQYKGG